MVRKRPERREYKIEESLGLGNVGLGKQHDLRPRATAVAFNSLDEAVRVPIDAVGASLSRRPRGAMARSSHVIALPWYHRRDYTALLMMVSDPPANASPAPVGSNTFSSGNAGAKKIDFSVNMNAPCSPFLMMT